MSAAQNEVIAMRLAELRESLDASLPGFPTLLRDIHMKLRDDPEQVAILTEEQIATLMQGLFKYGQVTITAKATGTGGRSKKTPITADDL